MDRWRWLQHERAERPPNHRLPNAASSGRDESAQRASSFLANENNGKDQCWSATVHLNRFGLAAAAACVTNLGACHHRPCIDTSSCRLVTLAELTASANAIPRRSYLFGASWPDVRRTLLVAVEQDGDPFAVLVPTAEIIRFYYAPSTRLAQAR